MSQTQDESLTSPSQKPSWKSKSLKPFKPPAKTRKAIEVSSASTTEEDMSEDGMDALYESIIREEAKEWLSTFGPKLFALESTKFLTQEARRKDLKSRR